jgi:hypothetical protein
VKTCVARSAGSLLPQRGDYPRSIAARSAKPGRLRIDDVRKISVRRLTSIALFEPMNTGSKFSAGSYCSPRPPRPVATSSGCGQGKNCIGSRRCGRIRSIGTHCTDSAADMVFSLCHPLSRRACPWKRSIKFDLCRRFHPILNFQPSSRRGARECPTRSPVARFHFDCDPLLGTCDKFGHKIVNDSVKL